MQHYKILSKYNSRDQIPGNTGRVYSTVGDKGNAYRLLVQETCRKETTLETRRRREGSIEMNLTEVRRCCLN